MSDVSRRMLIGAAAGAVAVGVSMVDGGHTQAAYLGTKLTAQDLGAINDGKADDGALITQGLINYFGKLGTVALQTPVAIDFGNATYHLKSPIVINQNFIRIVGEPKFRGYNIVNGLVINAGTASANVFGVEITGTLTGTYTGDAVLLQQGTQCTVRMRNRASVALAVTHFQGCYSCNSYCSSDAEQGASAGFVHRETMLPLNGQLYNTINSDIWALGYYNTMSGVYLSESQGFTVKGDIEHAQGPGLHLVNAQHGLVSIYTEANGQGATGVGMDTPDDVRLQSGGGQVVTYCDANMFEGCRFGGEMIDVDGNGSRETTPTNIHVISAYRTRIGANSIGGKIRLEAGVGENVGADQTFITVQARLLNPIEDFGTNTIRQDIRPVDTGGAGQVTGVTTILDSGLDSDNMATIMLPTPQADANFTVTPAVWVIDGTALTRHAWFAGGLTDRFYIIVDQKPGEGKAFNLIWTLNPF